MLQTLINGSELALRVPAVAHRVGRAEVQLHMPTRRIAGLDLLVKRLGGSLALRRPFPAQIAMQRVVKGATAWMPLNYAPGDEAVAALDKLRAMAEAAGRDPLVSVSTPVQLSGSAPRPSGARRSLLEIMWRPHLTLGTFSGRGHLRCIDGRTLTDHLAAIKRYWKAVADLL